jgi:hypothetical protein
MNAPKFQQLADRYRDLQRIAARDERREQLRQWPINLMRRLRPSKRFLATLLPWEPKTTRSEPPICLAASKGRNEVLQIARRGTLSSGSTRRARRAARGP